MKYQRTLILLIILISFLFILNSIKDDIVVSVDKLTSKGILDTKAALASLGISITIDDGPPEIYIDQPKNITYTTMTLDLKFTIVDLDLEKIYYNIDDGANITITGNTSFTTTIGSHTLNLFANDSLGNLNSSSVTFSVTAALPGVGISGGGGGGRAIAIQPDFILNTDLIKVSLLQGETKRELIEIENTGNSFLDLAINLENLKDFLIFPGGASKYNLRLNPKEKQQVQLIFNTAKDYAPGVYIGKILVSSSYLTKVITTIIEVESLKKIFDIDVKIPDQKVVKGNRLIVQISIFNLGNAKERVDTNVEYGIMDLDGNIITKESLTVAVETQTSFTEEVLVPKNLKDGIYIFYAIVRFDGESGSATELFEVTSAPKAFLALSTLYIYILPGIVFIIVILIIIGYLMHSHRRRKIGGRREEENIYGKLEKAIRDAREEGFNDKEIREELIRKGWIKEEIDYIMKRIK